MAGHMIGHSILLSETDIENAVINHYRKQGFTCLPDSKKGPKGKDGTLGWSNFSIFNSELDDKAWEPDVVSFKWDQETNYFEIKAVECKLKGSHKGILSAVNQIKIYKKHIPTCYIATEVPKIDVKENIGFVTNGYEVGFLSVSFIDSESKSIVEEIAPPKRNADLDPKYYIATRQKLAMLSVFEDVFKENIRTSFVGNDGYASTSGKVQYTINNHGSQSSIQFGINIETRGAIEATLPGQVERLRQKLKELDLGDYTISFSRKEMIHRQKWITTMILQKYCKDLTVDDVKQITSNMVAVNFQNQLLILKAVWTHTDLLSKKEHISRVAQEKIRLDKLRKEMNWD